MSSTRNKLKRLFQKPSSTASEAFAPRDLDRPPREFDEDGRPVDTSLQQAQEPAGSNSSATGRPAPSIDRSPNRASASAHVQSEPTPPPPPSKARGGARAQPHAHHTAPWAANAAFDSWKQQQGSSATSGRSPATPARPNTRTGEKPTSPLSTTQTKSKQTPSTSHTPTSPPGHVHRVGGARSKRTSMQASRKFEAWKKRRKQKPTNDEGTLSTGTAPQAPDTAAAADAPQTFKDHPPASARRTATKKSLPKDRVRRRAIRSKEAFLPAHARQYDLEGTPSTQAPPSKAEAGRNEQRAHAQSGRTERKLTMRATMAPTAQTPAERLMWISAHRHELSDEHIVSTLSAIEGTALRAGHEARRLRMLSESLLRLDRNDDALHTLHALQAIVPHDAWTLLRLAETCAVRADTMEAGLRWCEDALRLHPWLSQAQTLRDEIQARLQKLN